MELNEMIDELGRLSTGENLESAENLLKKLLETSPEKFSNADIKDIFLDLLHRNTPNINLLVVKCIAEATKNVEQRAKFSCSDILEKLMEMLDAEFKSRNIESTYQLCRALGNIFHTNDDARNIIFHHDGGQVLINLFDLANDEIKILEDLEKFSRARSAVTSNYLLGNEELSQKAIELKIIPKIKARIDDALNPYNDSILEHLLPLLSILIEQVSDLIFDNDIIVCIVKIFKKSTSSDIAESCLELLQSQADINDDIKLLLAREGICEHIFESMEKYKDYIGDVEVRSLIKLSCDLIVLVLTGDEAMHFLDQTPLLSLMEKWLDSSDDYIMTTSIVALGNFARTDNHCIKMVNDNIMMKLINILKQNIDPESDLRLTRALLSSIKNLVMPKENKALVIESGLVEIILPMLDNQPPVVFKVLGILRMLIDGQGDFAIKLLSNTSLVKKLVEWSRSTPDMFGVHSESSRLITWLVKNGYRKNNIVIRDNIEILRAFIHIDGSIEVLVTMLSDAHVVMQNEAVLALTIISILIQGQDLNQKLIASNVAESILEFIKRISETERITNEIRDNLKSFITVLKTSEGMKNYLDIKGINENLIPRMQMQELAQL